MFVVAENGAAIRQPVFYEIDSTAGGVATFKRKAPSSNPYDIGLFDPVLGSDKHTLLIRIDVKETLTSVYPFAFSDTSIDKILPYQIDEVTGQPTNNRGWYRIVADSSEHWNPLTSIVALNCFGGTAVSLSMVNGVETATMPSPVADKTFVLLDADKMPSDFFYRIPIGSTGAAVSPAAVDGHYCVWAVLDYSLSAIASLYSANIGNENLNLSADSAVDAGVVFRRDFKIGLSEEPVGRGRA